MRQNAHKLLAEQHVYWREQGRHALNFQQAGFERAAQEHEQAARDEVDVARAVQKGALEQRAEQSWFSHQVILLDGMNNCQKSNKKWKKLKN